MVDECGVAEHEEGCLCDVDLSKLSEPVRLRFTPLEVPFGQEACEMTDTGVPWDSGQLADLLECMGGLIEQLNSALPKWAKPKDVFEWRSAIVEGMRVAEKGPQYAGTARPWLSLARPLSFLIGATGLKGEALAHYLNVHPLDVDKLYTRTLACHPEDKPWKEYKGHTQWVPWVQRARHLRALGLGPQAALAVMQREGCQATQAQVDGWLRIREPHIRTPEQRARENERMRQKRRKRNYEVAKRANAKYRAANKDRINAQVRAKRKSAS